MKLAYNRKTLFLSLSLPLTLSLSISPSLFPHRHTLTHTHTHTYIYIYNIYMYIYIYIFTLFLFIYHWCFGLILKTFQIFPSFKLIIMNLELRKTFPVCCFLAYKNGIYFLNSKNLMLGFKCPIVQLTNEHIITTLSKFIRCSW